MPIRPELRPLYRIRKSARARWDREQRSNPEAMRERGKPGARATYRAKYGGRVYRAFDGRLWRVLRLGGAR